MTNRFFLPALLVACGLASGALAQTQPAMNLVAQSSETRFQMVFHVNDAALAKLLPDGWIANVATEGAPKDVNLRVIFLDAANTTGPDGKPLGKGRDTAVLFAVPVKKTDGSAVGQMIVGGISQSNPGLAFGALEQASTASFRESAAITNDSRVVTQDWNLEGGGSHIAFHVKFNALPANRTSNSVNFYNPADPKAVLIIRAEQANDILRNANTAPPDRVRETRFQVTGGKLGALFDGGEKYISWDSLQFYNRMVGTPLP